MIFNLVNVVPQVCAHGGLTGSAWKVFLIWWETPLTGITRLMFYSRKREALISVQTTTYGASASPSRELGEAALLHHCGRSQPLMGPATPVKGFGCRPIRDRSARTEGRRSKASREGTRGGCRVAAYGDLTAGSPARAMRWSAEQPGADPLRRGERRHCRFRQGDFGVTGGGVRMFRGHAATGLQHRKRHLPADGRRDEAVPVIMGSRS